MARKPYPSDVTDEEWAFAAGYLVLMREDAPQREHDLREVFNALRYFVRGGQSWRMLNASSHVNAELGRRAKLSYVPWSCCRNSASTRLLFKKF
jgi:transposase